MRTKIFFLALMALAAGLAAYAVFYRSAPLEPLPEIVFYDGNEKPVTLKFFSGRPALVNLWATWCAPCVAELPALDRLEKVFPGGGGLKVVAISLDRTSLKDVEAFLQRQGIGNLDVYWDKDRQVPLRWKYEGLPQSFLLDAKGRVVRVYIGPREWDQPGIIADIKAALP